MRDHPVVLRLVEIRTFLEKARPIDKKLAYQIEKLLRLASSEAQGGEEEGAGGADGGQEADGAGADPLAFRPNLGALVSKVRPELGESDGCLVVGILSPIVQSADAIRLKSLFAI